MSAEVENLFEIEGDLLESDAKYIAHQCNCVSRNSLGIAKSIFDKFPYSNTYDNEREIGKIEIFGDGLGNRFVINMNAQYYPGRPYENGKDSLEKRKEYFNNCLNEISLIENIESIAFPNGIACGLAGGSWKDYFDMIKKFAENNKETKVFIIKKV